MYCKNCGTKNIDEAKFCRNCGAELVKNVREQSETNVLPVKKKKKKLWIVIAIILILAAIAGGGFFAMKFVEEKRAEDYKNCMTQADKYLEKLDYKKAEASYLEAIKIDPKKEESYLKLADVYVVQEEYDKAAEILEKAEEVVGEDDSEINEKLEEIEERGEYTWIVEPIVEAEDIFYISETFLDDNHLAQQFKSPYAVIKKDDTLGLIDMEGKMKTEIEFSDIYSSERWGYILYKPDGTSYYIDQYDNLTKLGGVGVEPIRGGQYYWYNGMCSSWDGDEYLKDYLVKPESAIPIKQSLKRCNSNDWENLESLYAVCKDEKLVTDFEYDECGSCSYGLLAVCKNGKWGYINESGKTVIPLEYDYSWDNYQRYHHLQNGEKELRSKEYCYAASYGFVNLRKDGKWELRDTEGKLVILSGVFEKILPVYKGKCWVKKAGKWGVIQLANESDASEGDENGEVIFESMPSGFDFTSGAGGWNTHIDLKSDGAFSGRYYDSDLGEMSADYPNGTVYICDFTGRFSKPKQIDTYIYSMKLESLETEGALGEEYLEDGTKYIYSEPIGLADVDELRIYSPGMPLADLPEHLIIWLQAFMDIDKTEILPYYVIYNVNGSAAFVGYE